MKGNITMENKDGNDIERLRIIAGAVISVSVVALATIIGIFSASQSAETIAGIVGMSFTVVLIVIFLVIMPRPDVSKRSQKFFHMDNPILAIIVALITQLVAFLLGRLGAGLW
jgi:Mg2+/Co2+ transporter CorB